MERHHLSGCLSAFLSTKKIKGTMNRRITKDMADQASAKMMKKAYVRKIDNAKEKINKAVEELVRKYVPAPVIACVEEYATYFDYTSSASITAMRDGGKWGPTKENYICGSLSFKIPTNSRYITVDRKEYDALKKLEDKRKQLNEQQADFGKQVFDALVALRTEKNVEKELPEAMKYLVFPEVKAVLMPVFTGLRDIIGKIKED
jgi:hypothetical protein